MDASTSSSSSSSSNPQLPIQPLKNPKYRHISRSAAKRESVQLLGSIKDLQLHFSRVGLEHKPGVGAGVKGPGLGLGTVGEEEDEENRPPSSASGSELGRSRDRGERRPWKEVELQKVDAASARTEARELVRRVRSLWGLGGGSGSGSGGATGTTTMMPSSGGLARSPTTLNVAAAGVDPTVLLTSTAQSIRRVRTLALSVSHAQGGRRVSASAIVPRVAKGISSISTPSRPGGLPRAVSYGLPERKSSLGATAPVSAQDDALADLRKAALEVLAGLRALEERLRTQAQSPPTIPERDRAISPLAESISSSSVISGDTPATSLRPESSAGVYDEPEGLEDDEQEYNLNMLAAAEGEMEKHLETWEERIVSEGRGYRAMEAVEGVKERDAVRRWVGVVERLFEVHPGKEEMPKWAVESWEGRAIERVHDFLISHLPLPIQLMIPPITAEGFPTTLLNRLSDGFILTQAFNIAILASPKPWGFIPEDDIHDTVSGGAESGSAAATDEKAAKEWTFRRIGNLTCWAAAIRLRYNLPISMPTPTPSLLSVPSLPAPGRPTSPSPDGGANPTLPKHSGIVASGKTPTTSTKKTAERIEFDPLMVAKRAEGWEGMLAGLLVRWVEEAAREEREVGEVGASDSQTEGGSAVASQSQDSNVIEEVTDGQDLA